MNKITIGIDPDLNGAFVMIPPHGEVETWPIKKHQEEMDVLELHWIIDRISDRVKNKPWRIFIERPRAIPGHRGGNKLMDNYGLIRGLLIAHGLTGYEEVWPQTWQAAMFDLADIRQRAGNVKNKHGARKKLKLEIGRRIVKQELGLDTDHPGIIDAALIALWGRGK